MSAPPYYIQQQPNDYAYQPAPADFTKTLHVQAVAGAAPPPYYGHVQTGQQYSSNVVVVNQQPTPAFVTTVHPPVRDHYLVLSITLTVLCIVFGNWHALLCTIPAVIFSTMAGDAERRGDHTTAATHAKISLGLNIASIVAFLVGMVVSVAIVSIIVVRARAFIDDEGYYDSSCYSYQYEYYSC